MPTTVTTPATPLVTPPTSGIGSNNQNLLSQNQYSNTPELPHSSVSNSVSNEIGNSQFYIDSTRKSFVFNRSYTCTFQSKTLYSMIEIHIIFINRTSILYLFNA